MSNNQKNQTRPSELTNTLGDLQPNVVGFTIEARDLEKMAMEYLQASGFKPLKSTVITKDAGRGDLVLRQFVFFDRNDPALTRSGNGNQQGGNNAVRLNPALERKLPQGEARMNKQLFNALSSIALPDGKTRVVISKGLAVIEVDPILVTGFLLDAELGVHRIIITNVLQKRNNILIDVFKRLEENSFDPGANVDRFTAALRNFR